MITSKIDWDGKQNIVVIGDGTVTLRISLDDFIDLRAVQYVTELALEKADLALPPRPLRREKAEAPAHE